MTVVKQLWVTPQKLLQCPLKGRIGSVKNWFFGSDYSWKTQKFLQPLTFCLKCLPWDFGLFGLGPSWANGNIHYCPYKLDAYLKYSHVSQNGWYYMYVVLQFWDRSIHGQLFKGRLKSCNQLHVVLLPIPLIILSQKSLWRRSSYISGVNKLQTARGGLFTYICWVSCLRIGPPSAT